MERYMYYCDNCGSLGSAEHENPDHKQKCEKCKHYMRPLMVDINEWRKMTEDERKQVIDDKGNEAEADIEYEEYNDKDNNYEPGRINAVKTNYFSNIDNKIKVIAKIIMILCIISGTILFIYYLVQYLDNLDMIRDYTSIEYAKITVARTGMIFTVVYTLAGIASSFFIYGFGEIIYRLIQIDDKLTRFSRDNERKE